MKHIAAEDGPGNIVLFDPRKGPAVDSSPSVLAIPTDAIIDISFSPTYIHTDILTDTQR